MKNLSELNEELAIIQDNLNMWEMANIEKEIIVHNDREPSQAGDNLKFAHFHYKNIHFKMSKDCPKNITQLRELIAFESERFKIKDNELTDLLMLLQKTPTRKNRAGYKLVYDQVVDTWETLNEREADFVEI